eukprot:gene31835-42466_t
MDSSVNGFSSGADNISDLILSMLWKIASAVDDEQLLFVHYGPLSANLNRTITEAVASIEKRSANKLAISKKIQEKIIGGHNKGKGNRHKAFKGSHMTAPQQRSRRLAS